MGTLVTALTTILALKLSDFLQPSILFIPAILSMYVCISVVLAEFFKMPMKYYRFHLNLQVLYRFWMDAIKANCKSNGLFRWSLPNSGGQKPEVTYYTICSSSGSLYWSWEYDKMTKTRIFQEQPSLGISCLHNKKNINWLTMSIEVQTSKHVGASDWGELKNESPRLLLDH